FTTFVAEKAPAGIKNKKAALRNIDDFIRARNISNRCNLFSSAVYVCAEFRANDRLKRALSWHRRRTRYSRFGKVASPVPPQISLAVFQTLRADEPRSAMKNRFLRAPCETRSPLRADIRPPTARHDCRSARRRRGRAL